MELRKAALFVTDRCNLRCTYCYEQANGGRSIDPSLASKAIQYLLSRASSSFSLTLFGGEPLVNRSLLETLMDSALEQAEALGKKISFLINTNGTLLTPEIISMLEAHRVFIVLSLDGDRATHDFHRRRADGGSSYELVEKNLRHILGYRALHVRMTVTPDTVFKLHSNVQFIKSLGFRTLGMALNRDSDLWNEGAVSELSHQYDLLTDWYIDLVKSGEHFRIVDIDLFLAKGSRTLKKGRPPCSAGDGSIAIGPDGRIYPCHRFVGIEEAVLGDIDGGIDDSMAAHFRSYDPYSVEGCEGCIHIQDCYKCIWLSFVKHRSLSRKVQTACSESKLFLGACRKIADSLSGEQLHKHLRGVLPDA